MIVPGMFVCSSFLISVCMFIVSKTLLILSATVIVRTGGAIWLNPFAMVLFSVCSAITVFMNCLVTHPAICLGVFIILFLNVMELFSVVGGALLDGPCMVFHRMCVLFLWSQ